MRHRRIVLPLLLAAFPLGAARAENLDLERRLAAHRAVERVLWEHRIWPEANPEPKPSLEAVLPDRDLRDQVDDVLRKSAALADLWKRPLGAAELQAELDRMLRSSRDPKLLDAMLDAVDRDPLLAAEVIARPALADRLIRSWYAGESFDAWWAAERTGHAPEVPPLEVAALSAPQPPSLPTCAEDTWTPTSTGAPAARWLHSAVWTGTEMIVWGGQDTGAPYGNGARYTPATDSWSAVSNAGAPSGRTGHAAVWTGSQMVIWGGADAAQVVRSGGRYNPATNTWTATTLTGAPTERMPKAFVWTGSRLVVVGGDILQPGSGGRYDPVGDTWAPISTTGAPDEGGNTRTAVWTGTWMVVYPGARYDPVNNVWAPISGVGQPLSFDAHTAVWTGSRMIVWGGYAGGTPLNSGALYDPAANTWTPMTTTGAPSPRAYHTAVWLGGRMVVFGGTDFNIAPVNAPFDTGGRYDPATDTWAPTTLAGAPVRRYRHTAIATATEMIVWGGYGGPGVGGVVNTGGRYNPVTDTWVPTSGPAPAARARHSVAWTGTEAIFWGGMAASVRLQSGARYVPATDSWTSTAVAGPTPTARADATAVWTGNVVVIWGGDDGSFAGTGALYDPAGNSWSTMATLNSPAGRTDHTAVWTGTRMVVWGGRNGGGDLATGARYDPAANTWSATTSAGAPPARSLHTAVYGAGRMIVWGGQGGGTELETGGRYDPVADTWTPTSTSAHPVPRKEHAAVWTGTEMLVWGGNIGGSDLQTGSAYDPVIDVWDAFTVAGAPASRTRPRAVWTGSEMIVWGGNAGGNSVDTGGRYLRAQNTWQATTTLAAPSPREQHAAVWAGDQMVVWGGAQNGSALGDGGRYCACLTWYPDQDGDGYGDTLAGETTCNGSGPPAWIPRGGDCNDGNNAIHPGVGDGCNNVDDDCDFQTDEDYLPQPSVCGQGVCRSFGTRECVNGQIVNDCVAGTPNSPTDTSCNDLDDDCDGGVDEDFVPYPDHWVPIANAPSARTNYTAVSSGGEILVFGGDNGSGTVQTGGIAWSTTTDTWRALPPGPAKRWHHTAVFADTQMIVWGGDDNVATIHNTGSRYNPFTDSWAATTTTGAPAARGGHVAVWTGSRMVIWGGRDVTTFMNTGSRYDPAANSWSATTTTGAPAGRWQATAVWTGTEMIVWGGVAAAGTGLNTGGRYNPATNVWTAVTTTGAPSGRYGHVAVWTGTEMIVWGGTSDGTNYVAGGARYNPSSNTWTPMASVNQPSRRAFASAIWNGNYLFIWGGTYRTNEDPDTALANGARYYPPSDTWTTINPFSAPAARARTMAVLQAGEMWVWGGDPNGGAKLDGARYVPVTPCGMGYCQRTGTMVCSAGSASFQCTPGQPQPEVCDGFDDNCNGVPDDGIPVPGAAPMVVASKLPGDVLQLSWIATPNTTGYDVVRGRTSALHGSGGNFTLSTDTCIVNNGASTQVQDPIGSPLAEATFYLVRPVNACSGNGTFDESSPTQQGARDAEIAASGGACP